MRFLKTPHTISEYRHYKMPVYETIAAVGATTIIGGLTVGGPAAGAATAGAGALASYGVSKLMSGGSGGGGGGGGGGMPAYNNSGADPYVSRQQQSAAALQPYAQQLYNQGQDMYASNLAYGQQAQKYVPTAEDYTATQSNIFNTAANQGIDFARRGTQANIANQEAVTPGSTAQRQLANQQLNSYIQGQVPQDVQQQINRTVAQNLGGGFNLFSGGGQAPQNFARNIGQTSVGLSQYGLSAASTWQQLANQMVVSPTAGLSAGLEAQGLAQSQVGQRAGLGLQATGLGLSANHQAINDAISSFSPLATTAQMNIGAAQYGGNMAANNAENIYQSQANQYGANMAQQQNQQALGLGVAKMGLGAYDAYNKANYYNNLSGGLPSFMGTQAGANAALGFTPTMAK